MSKYKKQAHVIYKCDYHIVWVPKYRFRILTGEVGRLVDQDIRKLRIFASENKPFRGMAEMILLI